MKQEDLWRKATEFHGHVCPGVTIGYKAVLYAQELLDLNFSADEEVVCVAENDACGVDAIQATLGCSIGKGNLLFRLHGKQVFSFFNRQTGRQVRLVLKQAYNVGAEDPRPREEIQQALMALSYNELFEVQEPSFELPEKARSFKNIICDACGETAGDYFIRINGEQKLCLACTTPYERFTVR